MKNAFINYETPPKTWHDLIISPPIWNNHPIIFFAQKGLCPLMKSFYSGKNLPIL